MSAEYRISLDPFPVLVYLVLKVSFFSHARQGTLGFPVCHLDHKSPPFNRVDDDKAAFEEGIATPGPSEGNIASTFEVVILGKYVKVGNLFDRLPRRVVGQTRNVENAQPCAIIALECIFANDKLVVINRGDVAAEHASLPGSFKGLDVPEIGDRFALRIWPRLAILLIQLIVRNEVFLPCCVGHPSLVGIACTFIGGA